MMHIEQCRSDTPGCQERIHLNNAGASLMTRQVSEVIKQHLDLELMTGGYEAAETRRDAIDDAYDQVGQLIHAQPAEIALMANATDAFNKALTSIPLERDDMVLISRNDYISNHIAMIALQKRTGIRIRFIRELDEGGADPADVEKCLKTFNPKIVSVTHIPTNSGLIQPVEEIGKICRQHDAVYIVDACQSIGQLHVDVRKMQCDFLSATGRKYLRGPRGTGFLYVAKEMLDKGSEPLLPDMRGARWVSSDAYKPLNTARRFEDWENPYALLLGLSEAARYANALGMDPIEHRLGTLSKRLRNGLSAIDRVRVLDKGKRKGAIVTAFIQSASPKKLMRELRAHNINAGISLRNNALLDFREKGVPWALRLSPHYYNTEQEIDRCLEVIEGFTASIL